MYVVIVSFLWVALITPSVAAQIPPGSASSLSVSGPTFDEGSVQRIREALATYLEIESRGGWPALPQKASLTPGAKTAMVSQLRRRLVLSGDLAADMPLFLPVILIKFPTCRNREFCDETRNFDTGTGW